MLSLLVTATPLRAHGATVQIAPTTRYQTMSGWEVTLHAWEVDKINDRYDPTWKQQAPKVLDRLVNELGINRVRLEMRSGFENPVDYWSQFVAGTIAYSDLKTHWYEKINDNGDPSVRKATGFQFSEFDFGVETMLLPMKRLVEANGEKLYVNLNYVDFEGGLQGTFSHALAPAEYAEIVQVYLDHLRDKYGIRPDALEVILEPDDTVAWRGRQIGEAAVAVGARMRATGYDLPLVAPSNANPANVIPYFNAMAQVPGALDRLTTLSYHRYGSTQYGTLLSTAKANGLQTAMLEQIDAGIDQLLVDLTVAHASAWQKWGLATTRIGNGHFYYEVDLSNPSSPRISLEPKTALLAQYFKFIRIGATRVGASTDSVEWTPVAFVNPDGKHVVVIRTKSTTSAADAVIQGLPAGLYGVRSTDFSQRAVTLPDVRTASDRSLAVSIPNGVTTIWQKSVETGPQSDAGLDAGGGERGDAAGAVDSGGRSDVGGDGASAGRSGGQDATGGGGGGGAGGDGGGSGGSVGRGDGGGGRGSNSGGAGGGAAAGGAGGTARRAASGSPGCAFGPDPRTGHGRWLSPNVLVGLLLVRRRRLR